MTCRLPFTFDFLLIVRSRRREGTSSLDLLVALTLLVTVMSVATPLVVRHGRILASHRSYRLALDELSNQLDRLRAVPPAKLPSEVERLALSSFIQERLSGARLNGELNAAETGTRITLTLSWNDAERHRAPLTLTTWVFPTASTDGSATEEAETE